MVTLPQAIKKIPGAYFGMIGVIEVVVLLEIATIRYSLTIPFLRGSFWRASICSR